MKSKLFLAMLFISSMLFAQLPTDEKIHYPFTNGSLTNKGSSGTTNNLVKSSRATLTKVADHYGTANNALQFGRASSNGGKLSTRDFTISFWVNLSRPFNGGSVPQRILQMYGGGNGFHITYSGGNTVACRVRAASGQLSNKTLTTSVNGLNSGWHHFVVKLYQSTLTKATVEFYIDNTLKKTENILTNGANLLNNASFAIAPSSPFFEGHLDDVKVFTRAISNNEIAALYNLCENCYSLKEQSSNGSVTFNPAPSADGTYASGTVVTLTATPNTGYQFDSWSGDASGTTNPLTINVNANKTVTANFSIYTCAVNIPDANLKAMLVNNHNLNTNQDTEIQCSEATAYTGDISLISAYGKINDYTGLEALTEITSLTISGTTNSLQAINLTANTKLTSLYINDSNIQSIDISTLTNLKTFRLSGSSSLQTIDFSNNTALEEVYFQSFDSSVTSLDVSNLSNLKKLTVISRGSNTATTASSITSIVFGNSHPLLTELLLNRNNIQTIDVSDLTNLTKLILNENALTTLNIDNNLALRILGVPSNNLQTLSTRLNTNLESLSVDNNANLSALDLSTNSALTSLTIGGNNFSALNLSSNTNLNSLSIYGDIGLSTVDTSPNVNLEYFEMYNNTDISTVDLSNNASMLSLDSSNNSGLKSINLANGNNGTTATSLSYVNLTNNSNLTCIQHDTGFDPTTTTNWTKDATATWSTTACATASVNDYSFSNEVTIYPNPVATTLNITTTQSNISTVELYTILGKKVLIANEQNIDVSNLANGMYLVKIKSTDGKIASKKFIKQ